MAKENQNKKPLRYLVAYRLQGAKENDYKTALIFAYDKKEAGEVLKRYADAKHLALNSVVIKRLRRKFKPSQIFKSAEQQDTYYYNRQNEALEKLEKEGAQA